MKFSAAKIMFVLAGVVLLPTVSTAQVRDCVQGRSLVQMGFDEGTSAIQVRSGKSCMRSADFPGFMTQKFEIVEQPRHGRVIHHGRGHHEYKANSGYSGPDSYKIRWVGNRVDFRTGQTVGPTSLGARTSVNIVN